jgi:hypothetical protein
MGKQAMGKIYTDLLFLLRKSEFALDSGDFQEI